MSVLHSSGARSVVFRGGGDTESLGPCGGSLRRSSASRVEFRSALGRVRVLQSSSRMSSWSVDGRSQADTRPSVTAAKEEVSESASALVSFAALTPRKRVRPSGL